MTDPPARWDAAAYDRVANPQEQWGRAVVERMQLAGDETVLDAGCGTGRVTEVLLQRLPRGRVVALDADAGMLGQARQRLVSAGNRVEFVAADLSLRLELPSAVDAILSTATFHWVPNHAVLFANLAAVLRSGGALEAQCGGAGNVDNLRRAVEKCGYAWDADRNFATAEETASRLEVGGWVDINTWLEPSPIRFSDADEFEFFLRTVCLRPLLPRIPEAERGTMVERVMSALDEPVLEYVRLNIHARRP